MITAQNVTDVAIRFLGEDADIRVVRSSGGFSNICGYQLTVYYEEGSNQTFFHDDNTVDSLVRKMIPFAELVEAECLG